MRLPTITHTEDVPEGTLFHHPGGFATLKTPEGLLAVEPRELRARDFAFLDSASRLDAMAVEKWTA